MSDRSCIVIADDDAIVAESLACALDRGDQTVVLCNDTVAAELAVERLAATHVVADVQFTGAFGFEGLRFVERTRKHNHRCRVVLMSGNHSRTLRDAALAAGASGFLAKPFAIEELEHALELPEPSGGEAKIVRIEPIDVLVRGTTLSMVFQPIVRLAPDGSAVTYGYEALTRVGKSWPFAGAGSLFDYAERCDRLADLDLACIARAIDAARELPVDSTIFLNVNPVTFSGDALPRTLCDACRRGGIDPRRIIIELTERDGLEPDAAATFDALRAAGFRFALDDVGSAHSHLNMIERIRPSFMKVSQDFGTGFESDETRQRIVQHVMHLAHDFGCDVVLEGVETPDTARAAARLAVHYAQGWHFGRPAPAAAWASGAAGAWQ